MTIQEGLAWFAGGRQPYMGLAHCMNHDWPWIGLTVTLDICVAIGYILIAMHWRRDERTLTASPAKSALADIRNIFIACGLCGYLFIPIKMFWPAWRLYDLAVFVLLILTWRYALSARNLHVVYHSLGRNERMAADLASSRAEATRKGKFLDAIGHDLRTPWNGLVLQVEAASMDLEAGDIASARASLDEIRESVRRSTRVLDSFLEVGQLEWSRTEDKTPVLPTEFLIDEAIGPLVDRARSEIRGGGPELRLSCPEGLVARTDRAAFEAILGQLLDNAVRFTERGHIEVEVRPSGSMLSVAVEDTGIGIAPEDRGAIFEDFFQVQNGERDRFKGVGLGLSIARRQAMALGGTLEVGDRDGGGSRFVLAIPGAVAGRGRGR